MMPMHSPKRRIRPTFSVLAIGLLLALAHVAFGATLRVIEFYNAAQDHYFITASPAEIADLDTGVHPGWQRTGLSFDAYDANFASANPVCRFYIPPSLGDSHFFSASPGECALTQARFPAFDLETADAFYVIMPDALTGACPMTSIPLYRLWNNRTQSNHRYTTDRVAWQHMRSLGWIAEGYGNDGVAMCTPASSAIAAIDVAVGGRAVIKTRAGGNVVAMLQERLTSIFQDGPDRTLALLQADGRTATTYTPPAGWSLVDFAVHPSGEISVVLTTNRAVRIVRLDRNARPQSDQPFTDAEAAHDPFFDFDVSARDDDALQPVLTHDAARLAPLGESLALVLRTGRNAVVAYRLDLDDAGEYAHAWRTLVEPGSSIDGVFLTSGSFDTFGQLANHVGLQLDADATGMLAIGLTESPFRNFVFQAHAEYFGEPIAAQAGALVTRISADGRRLGSSVVDTQQLSELHGLRATGTGFVLQGRVRTALRSDGSGWDAYVAAIDLQGSVDMYRIVDIDRGDVLFDATMLPNGHYLALGTTGYVQNPSGASISEDTQPLLLLLDADGSVLQRASVADGPRQDQLRSILSFDGRWLVGGMRNGPGTHSGDAQPQLITADGYLTEMSGLPMR
jgi:hypothetical protein